MSSILPLSENQLRQYIDAQTAFDEQRRLRAEASRLTGGMFWRDVAGHRYLIRTSARGAQKSLGLDDESTRHIHAQFAARKQAVAERLKSIDQVMDEHRRMNKALRVGRAPAIVVRVLNVLEKAGLSDQFIVVGTHALYAYESAAGVRFMAGAMATRDIDLLFDTRRRMALVSRLRSVDSSFIGLLRKADKSFERLDDRMETARNAEGFEVDVIRRMEAEDDPHPLRLSGAEDDLWAVQADTGEQIMHSPRLAQMVVSAQGDMATMHTITPLRFAAIKRKLADLPQRDPLKKGKDRLQADLVEALVAEHLPQFRESAR